MSSHPISKNRFTFRAGIIFLILTVFGAAGVVPPGNAQKPASSAEPGKPAQKQRVEEEVGPAKKPIRVEDRDPLAGAGIAGFVRESQQAKHPAVRSLYAQVALPHDEVQFTGAVKTVTWVEPIRAYVGPGKTVAEAVDARTIDDRGRVLERKTLRPGDVAGVTHYEELVLAAVNTFLDPMNVKDLPRLDGLVHAEKILAEAMRFHETARERDLRAGRGWEELEKRLRGRLLVVRLEQLQALAEAQNGAAANELARLLATTYPGNPEVRAAVLRAYIQHAERILDDKRNDTFIQVRLSLEHLDRLFPGADDAALRKLRSRLEARAKALATEAEQLAGKDRTGAGKLVTLAESIWPQLAALPRLRQQLQLDSILFVGVPELPTFLSPALAGTDTERQALELIFESLVRLVPDAAVGQAYEPVLAAGMPRLLPLGRQVQLVSDARWYREAAGSDKAVDEPLTGTDVWKMLDRFQKHPEHSRAYSDLVADTTLEDALKLRVKWSQGFVNPLALLTFKVLPANHVDKLDDPAFAQRPIGSGPYMYVGREKDVRAGVEYAVFRANPKYAVRAGKAGQPAIREIHFYSVQGRELRADFKHDRLPHLHLLLDVDAQTATELTSAPAGLNRVKVQVLPSRRVHFLAVNQRQAILQEEPLRRALAAAIDRETILNQCFRDTSIEGPKLHKVLNGPYPADSWACCNPKELRAGVFDPDKARSWAKQAKAEGRTLELKYPAGRPEVAKACAAIRDQVKEHTGIVLNLVPCSTAELRQAVEIDHKYQLAYYHWDHADDSYWLKPLFDPEAAGPGGPNFMGVPHDATLANLFRELMRHRDFGDVQRLTHRIHQHLDSTMPLVPLWQLDVRLALHDQLKIIPAADRLDPLAVFSNTARWKLEK
ncbi:hypothetical protein AYO44_03880 [Planctomycetaceae bacterium SCGC AG-212-F19]|nr:hypothetical protein AYO44_03880 [Planctomycetaceae bacterium SCGC AG-212-F19]